jgi:NAD(P)-dependent dehydrogenase (short-subunit alcohol dehydrogenase family)
MKKTVFITGASSGLGKAVALLFANRGWKVLATMRDPGSAAELASNEGITVLPLDVTDTDQITRTVTQALALGRVDVVVNNAGYGMLGPLEGTSEDDLRRHVDTNLMGALRVTKAFLPHFRANRAGVFIAITSVGGHVAFPFFSIYHATKWALEGWNESVAFELAPFGIQAKTVAPGRIASDFDRSLRRVGHPAYDSLMAQAESATEANGKPSSAQEIAEVVYTAATDGKRKVHYLAGADAKMIVRFRRILGMNRFVEMIRKRVLA